MNGKPGNHPITDILRHNLSVYGEPTDGNIRQLGKLMDYHRLCDWFDRAVAEKSRDLSTQVKTKLAEMQRHAQESGWEAD